jgi:hypothetical protein
MIFFHCLKNALLCSFLLKLKLVVGYVFNWNHLCIMSLVSGLQSLEFGMLGCVVTSVGVCVL